MINSLGGLDNVPEMTGDETIEGTQTQEQRKETQEVKKAANGLCTNGVTVVGTTCLWQRHLHTAYAICSNAQKEKRVKKRPYVITGSKQIWDPNGK